jgi:glyoxylase-like metal-dependent hydrolase (beta-lactamase superfamily II)
MTRFAILATVCVTGLSSACLRSQQLEPIAIERLHDTLFVISGAGGNSAIFVRGKGVVLVDTKIANTGQRLLDVIRSVTDKPITHIVNTHSHFDHIGSNGYFPASVEVVAHENAAAQMVQREELSDASTKHGLADRTFKDSLTLFSDNDAIDLHYFGAAHTSGDAFVVFRALRVLHAGDTYPGPNPVTRDGGSAEAYPATMSKAAALTGIERVIPGHGTVAPWQQFVEDVKKMGR